MSEAFSLYSLDLRKARSLSTESLSQAERERAATLVDPCVRQPWMASRAWLRLLLSEWLGRPADRIEFGRGSHGKPFVRDAPGVCFSLSHSGSMMVCAIGRDVQLGLDIEPLNRRVVPACHWWRVLSADELQTVGRSRRRFLQAWVRKEAILKAEGIGLGHGDGRATGWRLSQGTTNGHCWALAWRSDADKLQLGKFGSVHGSDMTLVE